MSEPRELSPELEQRLGRYRAGIMSESERVAFEWEALSNEALAEALYGEISLDAVGAAGRTVARDRERLPAASGPAPFFRPVRRAGGPARWLPLAASLLFVMGIALWSSRQRPAGQAGPRVGGDALRGGAPTLVPLEPVGTIAESPRRLRWSRDPGAASYRVELFDHDARRIGVAVTAETTLVIGALTHQPLDSGQWRVVPLSADGLELPRHVRASFTVTR